MLIDLGGIHRAQLHDRQFPATTTGYEAVVPRFGVEGTNSDRGGGA